MQFLARLLGFLRQPGGRNLAFSSLAAVANPLLQLLILPRMYRELGGEMFGLWILVNAIIAASGIANFGLGEATTKYVALYRAQGDLPRMARFVGSISVVYFILGLLVCLALGVSAPWLAENIFGLKGTQAALGVAALRVAGLAIWMRFVYTVWESMLRGFERYDLESVAGIVVTLAGSLGTYGLVAAGAQVPEAILWSALMLVAGSGLLVILLGRVVGNFDWLRPRLSRPELKEAGRYGVFTWLQSINGVLSMQLDRLVIGAWLGPAAAGQYSVCLQIVQTCHTILAKGAAMVFPLAVRYQQEGRAHDLRVLFNRGMAWTTWLGWMLSALLIFFGNDLLRLWMGAKFQQGTGGILAVLGIWNAFMASSVIPFYFLNAIRGERLNVLFGAMSTGVFVGAAAWFIPLYGALGAAFARLTSISVTLVTRTMLYRRIFSDRRWFAGLLTLLPTAGGCLACGPLWLSPVLGLWWRGALFGISSLVCLQLCARIYGNDAFIRLKAK